MPLHNSCSELASGMRQSRLHVFQSHEGLRGTPAGVAGHAVDGQNRPKSTSDESGWTKPYAFWDGPLTNWCRICPSVVIVNCSTCVSLNSSDGAKTKLVPKKGP